MAIVEEELRVSNLRFEENEKRLSDIEKEQQEMSQRRKKEKKWIIFSLIALMISVILFGISWNFNLGASIDKVVKFFSAISGVSSFISMSINSYKLYKDRKK